MITQSEIEILWQQLSDIPIGNTECIEEDFHIFKKGTDRIEIWYWFDEMYKQGVYKLIFPDKKLED